MPPPEAAVDDEWDDRWMDENEQPAADTLNDVGVLVRREIEARIVVPLIDRFSDEFGRERVTELLREVVVDVAREQGGQLAAAMGGNGVDSFAGSLEAWTRGGALEIDVVEQSDSTFAFNVTRCRYAEMYRDLGVPELGAVLSCNRDGTLAEGFNPDMTFTRTQTIMGGATHCDFRYTLPPTPVEISPR